MVAKTESRWKKEKDKFYSLENQDCKKRSRSDLTISEMFQFSLNNFAVHLGFTDNCAAKIVDTHENLD